MTLREFQKECYRISKEHGFHPEGEEVAIDQKLLLAVGELVEAQNEMRSGHTPAEIYFAGENLDKWNRADEMPVTNEGLVAAGCKPEGFGVELADAVIRIFDLAEAVGVDLEHLISLKMAYNESRPYKHGKKF